MAKKNLNNGNNESRAIRLGSGNSQVGMHGISHNKLKRKKRAKAIIMHFP